MHVYFSGIGGTAIGPLALIAKQAGYEVSGSDKQPSQYLDYLKQKGVGNIHVGQSREQIEAINKAKPIDWLIYTSAVLIEDPNHPEITYARQVGIKTSKRDELLNKIITDHGIKLVAIAGTHGKTTTTAMVIWLFKQLAMPISYSVGAKINFGDMGQADLTGKYFVLEADEFDYNFLAFRPELAVISGVGYDHHEIYPTEQAYQQAFAQFINQSHRTILWQTDAKKLNLSSNSRVTVQNESDPAINDIKLAGLYNRRDGWLAVQALAATTQTPLPRLAQLINGFPGVGRRFEQIVDNLYSDYAHTPEKIVAAMNVASETAKPDQKVVVVYEPLTNRRMHYTAAEHQDIFNGAKKIYWVPSYLAREDPSQLVLSPNDLIKNLSPASQSIAEPAELNTELKAKLNQHLAQGDLVLALSGGGGGSLDEWLREQFP